jgi:hypothetical protein
MVGMKLSDVASANSGSSEHDLALAREAREKENGPIVLKRRNGTPIPEPQLKTRPQGAAPQEMAPPPEGTSFPQAPPAQQ